MLKKEALVIHSGGMDSSLCLALAIQEHGKSNILSLSFSYQQRHSKELKQAEKISRQWGVDHTVLEIACLKKITSNALLDSSAAIEQRPGEPPNTLVVGRNGLMARLGAIHANSLGAHSIYMGIMELEGANSGYRDCSRRYMDMMQEILRLDLDDPHFKIKTPFVRMTKKETLEVGYRLGVLEFLLKETITCYEGIALAGCMNCPACKLRNAGIAEFLKENPNFTLPYSISSDLLHTKKT